MLCIFQMFRFYTLFPGIRFSHESFICSQPLAFPHPVSYFQLQYISHLCGLAFPLVSLHIRRYDYLMLIFREAALLQLDREYIKQLF